MVPAGAILKKDEIVGNIARVPMVKDEPIFSGKVGDTPRFSGLVKEGMRAYTILTPNDSTLVAGLVEPGDRVDILFTDKTDKAMTGGASTVPLMQNIEVMAIGRVVDPDESRDDNRRRMRSVTLSVPLEMASMLALAQEMGTLHLALRSEQDQATADVSAVTLRELLHTAYPALFAEEDETPEVVPITANIPAEPRQPSQIAVRTLRGSVRSTMVMRASTAPSATAYIENQPMESAAPLPLVPNEFPWIGDGEGMMQ
jgi:pilus assembly protein CpaB